VCLQYDNLDSEHQALFKCIAKCAENRGDAAALADLVKVTVDHFADEEVSQNTTVKVIWCAKPVSCTFAQINSIGSSLVCAQCT